MSTPSRAQTPKLPAVSKIRLKHIAISTCPHTFDWSDERSAEHRRRARLNHDTTTGVKDLDRRLDWIGNGSVGQLAAYLGPPRYAAA
jgi:hypothetical protein